MDHVEGSDQQMRRRTVVKGAAWAAPVVTLGVAAPSLAASPPPVAPSLGGTSCKHTEGVKRYHVELVFKNGLNCPTTVHISKFVVIANSGQEVTFSDYPPVTDFQIPRYSQLSWVYDSDVMGNISQGNVQVVYTYTDCDGNVQNGDVTLNVGELPPCDFPYPHDGTTNRSAQSEESTTTESDEATAKEPVADSAPAEDTPVEAPADAPVGVPAEVVPQD